MLVKPIEILLVEDDQGDVLLTRKSLEESKVMIQMNVINDGMEALDYLNRKGDYADYSPPDLILLDLNLPKKDGREVLAEIKQDENLKKIPVVILTTSDAEEDILKSYNLGANCYVTKPVGLEGFSEMLQSIGNFWFTIVKLPPK